MTDLDRPPRGDGPGAAHVLVIEDDPAVRFNMVSFLEDSGYTVSEEGSGEHGIDAVSALQPDLVLCDLRMPGLDGLDVLQQLHTERPDLPVVMVSGTGVLGDAVRALRQGAWDFVTKPIQDMAILEHAINGALEKARLQRDNRGFQHELQRVNERLREHVAQLEHEVAAGRNLQLQLMPSNEEVLGTYLFSRYLLPSMYLSGDLVDYFAIDDTHMGFYLADVSGHGVSSAFVTVLLKSLVDRHVERCQADGDRLALDPAALLGRLNTDLLAQRLDKYTTLFYGIVDTAQNHLTFCNGGHFPMPVIVDGNSARFLDHRGYPVGLLPRATFENVSLDLPKHHRVVLFSDGVLDALPQSRLADKRTRLLDAARRAEHGVYELLDMLGLEPDGAYPDDITLMIAERTV